MRISGMRIGGMNLLLMGGREKWTGTTRKMYTVDARLTPYDPIKAVEVPDGGGGVNEILHCGYSAGIARLVWVTYVTSTLLADIDPGGGSEVAVGTNGPNPYDVAWKLATQRRAGARASGDTFTHIADCLIECTVTSLPNAGQSIRIIFRTQDANNHWFILIDDAGGLILYERVAGAATLRGATAAGVVAAGHRVVVIAEGEAIRIYSNNVYRFAYASAANFKTLTSGSLTIGAGGGWNDLVSWPRYLAGKAKRILDKVSA